MRVSNSEIAQTLITAAKNAQPKTDEFAAQLEKEMLNNIKSQKGDVEKEVSEVDLFKERLSNLGAVLFYQQFNLEKIEKLIEEKRKEFEKALGLDEGTIPPLEGEERVKALNILEEMLKSFMEQLKDEMEAKAQLEDNKSPLNSLLQG